MGAIQGRLASLEVSEDGDTFYVVGGIIDLSLSRSYEEHERTTYDSAGQKNFDLGHEDRTMTFSAHLDEDDSGQVLLVNYAEDKQALHYRYKQKTGGRVYTGRAIVTQLDMSGELDSTAGLDVTLRCLPLDYGEPSLDLPFAETLSLRDTATETYPVTFTRATNATYVGADGLIKTAAINEPRFDHDPTTGESLGLLIEEQRTNVIDYSERLDLWTRDSAQISISTGHIAPDGSTNAWLLNKYGPAGWSSAYRQIIPVTGTNVHSWFLKAGTALKTIVSVYDSTTDDSKWSIYSWSNGVPSVISVTANAEAFDPVYYGNGWWRVSVKVLNLNSANPNYSFVYPVGLGTETGTVYAWGAQIEAAAFPTSYIPTAGAAATRNTDEAYITGTNFSSWYNPSEGSLFAQYQRPVDYDSAGPFGYPTGHIAEMTGASIFTERLSIASDTYLAGDQEAAYVAADDVGYTLAFPPSAGARQEVKMCLSVNGSQLSASRDGSAVQSILIARMPNVISMTIGNFPSNIGDPQYKHNGTIKRITYYRSRLPNLHLQTLTEP